MVSGEKRTDELMSSMNLSRSLPLMPALLMIANRDGKAQSRGREEGGKGQIDAFSKNVE